MQLGRFTIEQLTEGQFELIPDGSINRVPLADIGGSQKSLQPDISPVGINPLYITDGTHHVLLDVGLGWGLDAGSPHHDISNVCTNLNIFGVSPADITHVVLTHLHYDHAAGATFTNHESLTRPTFRNAKYIIQQAEWDFAVRQVQHKHSTDQFYKLDDLYRLYADDFLVLVDEEQKEIIPGITTIKTGGHTPGHQVVKIVTNTGIAYFPGDLVSNSRQLNYFDISGRSVNQVQAKKMKINVLRQAYREEALLFFYHSVHCRVGRLQKDEDENYVLKEV